MPAKVLFIHHRSELGGAPTSLSYLIEQLDRDLYEPHVYCPEGPAAGLFRAAGASVHTGPIAGFTHIWASTYQGRRWLLFLRELLRLLPHLRELRHLLRREGFDIVHLNDSPLLPAAVVAHRRGIPIIWHLRSSLPDADSWRSRAIRYVIRRLAAATIAINDDLNASFGGGSEVIPNSVDLVSFSPDGPTPTRSELGVAEDRPIVSYFGFIYPSKGFREFLKAAALVRRRGLEAAYLIVGGAVRGDEFFATLPGRVLQTVDLARNYEREAAQLVDELGVQDTVRFISFTQQTAEIYRASDIVVAPSRGPELGRPVIEAAASAVPVIASGSRSGARIVVPEETGILVDAAEPNELADAIEGLLRDPARRELMGRAARNHAEAHFDAAKNARRVESVYARVLPQRDRTPVLYVHHRPQLGGAPVSLAQLIEHLDDRFEAHVIVPPGPASDLFERAGAIVHPGEVSIFSHTWDNPYAGLRWVILLREIANLRHHLRHIERLMREYRFPIVHINDSPILPAARVAHRYGARVVWHLRSALANEGADRRSRIVTSLMDRWGDWAVAIDEDVAATFKLKLPMSIVNNSTSPPRIDPVAEQSLRRTLPLDRVLIGFAGFIRRQKGWPELVEAARILVDRGVPAHFVVIGGGVRPPVYFSTLRGRLLRVFGILQDEESAIKNSVAQHGLSDHFSFLPFTSETAAVYRTVDIVTFPNQGTGLGRPVLEAAALGKPVVASGSRAGGGVMIPDETGILLSDPTPAAIAGALEQLVGDPELRERMGRAGAEYAGLHFDPVKNAEAIEDLYDRLLRRAPTPTATVRADAA